MKNKVLQNKVNLVLNTVIKHLNLPKNWSKKKANTLKVKVVVMMKENVGKS